jgi:uncharacterized membrane protein
MKSLYKAYLNDEIKLDKLTLLAVISLLIVITGIFGFTYEFIFYYFNSGMKTFFWRGSNFLPWINIYATGSIMIYFLTHKFKKKPLLVFLISFISTGILEYISGFAMYKLMNGIRCWNYNTEILNFGNINGFVCLRSVTFFGISGLILMYALIPFVLYLSKKINKKLFITISISLCVIFLFDELYNLIFAHILSLPRARDIYTKLGFNYMNYYK